ncbi:hypothetical protein PEPE_0263 [Pediococcus pentosaceus ATCC 25745]|uniref:Uncharacterized protein n=1 Tax=Pediococcus pentosaceus (strain ATCC 25745 / CCUG 21536 / LMG 10740 / 183-1w) TaxID=278197 RepID=Q03HG2_PEDPA|nr:hypothetical protein PEPE_0263 [Pediococcus pentosaceus ATCC 25745]
MVELKLLMYLYYGDFKYYE